MKSATLHFCFLFFLSASALWGGGLVAWKEQSFHKDSLANVAAYRQKKITGYEGIFDINGKEVYLSTGRYWFIELPNNLPFELSDSIQYEDLIRKKSEMYAFQERFSKSSPVLDPWLKKLQEYQDKYDSGQYLIEGSWVEKATYEKQQAELKEKRRLRKLEQDKKLKAVHDKGIVSNQAKPATSKEKNLFYEDGSLFLLRDGSLESAQKLIKSMEDNQNKMSEGERELTGKIIRGVKSLFQSQRFYQNALKQREQAKIEEEKWLRRAESYMEASPLTGKPKVDSAGNARRKAKEVIIKAESQIKESVAQLRQVLAQVDVLACDLYPLYQQDAESLISAMKIILQGCSAIHFDGRFEAVKAEVDRQKEQLPRAEEKVNESEERDQQVSQRLKEEALEKERQEKNKELAYEKYRNLENKLQADYLKVIQEKQNTKTYSLFMPDIPHKERQQQEP